MRIVKSASILIAATATLGLAATAGAQDVQSGIAAWQAGDYARAVQEWRPLADAGNADAQFNLAQAYRLGRGLPQNLNLAEQWFERAARQRHEQAGASLGLLLFQNGRAREAMPWLQAAAQRGDPRAQYVFGTALFNGDVVRRDLPRAYALMRAAAGQGFPQAQAQLAEMDRQMTPQDRQRSETLAADLATPPAQQLAEAGPPTASARRPAPGGPGVSYAPPPERRGPDPIVVPPPDPGARRPGGPGISYAPPREDGRPAIVAPRPHAHHPPAAEPPRPRPDRPAPPVSREPAPQHAASGGAWQVQLGAFSSDANARRQWETLRRRVRALGGLQVAYQRAGNLVRVRAGGFADRAAADRVCASVRAAGAACIPVR